MKKSEIIYQEKYRNGAMVVRKDCLPKRALPHMTKGTKIIGIEILSAGKFKEKSTGQVYEFQDLRIYAQVPQGSEDK